MTKINRSLKKSHSDVAREVNRYCVLTRTRRISRIITSIYDEQLRPYGVNAPQFSLLVLVARLGGATRAEIGRANYQDRSTLSRNLGLLLSEGWIEEIPSAEGGRSRPIVISRSGSELLVSAASGWRSAQLKAEELLGKNGVSAIVHLADGIAADTKTERT
ncbi:MarR family transcriptional regulator [Rhizobium sp. P32RR-XVIII]|uniref:MarR family winged helix-turn-helix transcriptional regulator n=1 Tax=Rhizobium sp. P32RR-XVIII TaxID=2726738 RepID=UPI0014566E2D|nr:MarR family transcriptional regulator [Rhizobium sp. P32RR-XVIII]NLS07703.1 MarR family transcriptional regulator [Rhizobium sp. P32RR-XVIII]